MSEKQASRPAGRKGRIWKRILTALALVLAVLILCGLGGALWFTGQLEGSLPQLDGEASLTGLQAAVEIERDALGVPTIRGANRLDVARGLGFLHAQDRFFQMDLMLRRRSAGEVSVLMGPSAFGWDETQRAHRFRERARRIFERLPAEQRSLIEAYTEGVNAGLEGLGAKPFEYLLLRIDPEPWRSEDTLLVVFTQFLELQSFTRDYERALHFLDGKEPAELVDFLTPVGTRWDAPMRGEPLLTPPIPPASVLDLRAARQAADLGAGTREADAGTREADGRALGGSNAFTVADAVTAGPGALLANDLHLSIQVPNIWYRASLVWPAEDGSGEDHRVTGATLPGTPAVVVGSNGHVAWGLTSSLVDASDVILLDVDPSDENRYLTPEGPRPFERFEETLEAAHGESRTVELVSTVWGPVVGSDRDGHRLALRWVAHEEEAVNLAIIGLETATTVEEALDVARLSGVPAQNFHVVDEQGRIAWTILGRLPKRVGCDGRRPASWADGSCRWDGLLPPEEAPRILDPESGRLWSANNRTVGGEAFALLGDGGYRIGARAGQIRDDLFALEAATPRDLLAIQLDDRALFYQRWSQLLLSVLTPEALEGHPDRRELRRLVETWDGRASVDSAAYRLVRAFRIDTAAEVLPPLLRAATEADPDFTYLDLVDQAEGPLWRLVSERPPHLLNPRFADWDELFLAAADEFLDYYADLGDGLPLAQRTWGQINQSYIRHVMSEHLPFFASGWLDMPSEAMAGDLRMPRVHLWDRGATLRMVVSPGREEEGFFTMPVGQSGHPMSPHYGDSHGAWSRGEAAPFLPGPAVHTLILRPAGS